MTIWISRQLPLFNFKLLDILCTLLRLPCDKLTIWISRELPLCNFERLGILCAWIGLPCDKLWPFEFLNSFRCLTSSFSIYYAPESDFRLKSYDHLNFSRAFVVQFRASRSESDFRVMSYDHLNFSRASVFQFRGSRYIIHLNRTSVW